jgi:preprotein translocase subunit SecF
MIKFIQNSRSIKVFSIMLSISMLSMSFTSRSAETLSLKAGTVIAVESASEINSGNLVAGQSLDFFVVDDVKVNNKTVIRRGARAKAHVTRVNKAKGLGKEGSVEVEIKSVEAVDGTQVRLTSARVYEEGEDRQTAAILLGVLVCILFLTKKGKNAVIPPGFSVDGRVAQDVQISVE